MNSGSMCQLTDPGQTEVSTPAPGTPGYRPDASQLKDRVPAWAQLPRQAVLWTAILGILWLFLSYQPVWHTDIWGHLFYGRLLFEQGAIPATEPVLPLAKGVPFEDTAWLSQVLTYWLYSHQGVTSLRFLYAASLMTCMIALLVRFRERTNSTALCLVGLAVFLAVVWKSLFLIRPQLAGLVCYVLLLTILVKKSKSSWDWILIPALFALWSNLHGSFFLGLGLLGILCLGRAADLWLRTGKWNLPFRDAKFIRLFLLTQLALISVLANPYGIGIFSAVETIASSPNLRDLVEWGPITLRMTHGQGFALVVFLLVVVYRLTPRRISIAEVLLLTVYGLAALWMVRMMVWWTPIAAWFLVLHGSAVMKIWDRKQAQILAKTQRNSENSSAEPGEEDDDTPALLAPKSGMNTVLVLGLSWIFFAYTPFGATLLHGYPSDPAEFAKVFRQNVSRETPVDLTRYLLTHEPQGLVLNTYEWGDYLLWAGPKNIQLYLNSHAHLLPAEVWKDYFLMVNASPGWDDKLDRYGINTVILNKTNQPRLIEALRENSAWKLDYESRLGVIFLRVIPIENQ